MNETFPHEKSIEDRAVLERSSVEVRIFLLCQQFMGYPNSYRRDQVFAIFHYSASYPLLDIFSIIIYKNDSSYKANQCDVMD